MPRHGKQYNEARGKIEARPYVLGDAIQAVRGSSFAKFDETLEVHMRLGVDRLFAVCRGDSGLSFHLLTT